MSSVELSEIFLQSASERLALTSVFYSRNGPLGWGKKGENSKFEAAYGFSGLCEDFPMPLLQASLEKSLYRVFYQQSEFLPPLHPQCPHPEIFLGTDFPMQPPAAEKSPFFPLSIGK